MGKQVELYGKMKSVYKYQWRYGDSKENIGAVKSIRSARPIMQLDMNNNCVGIYKNAHDVERKIGYCMQMICERVKNGKPYRNYYWKYLSEYLEELGIDKNDIV